MFLPKTDLNAEQISKATCNGQFKLKFYQNKAICEDIVASTAFRICSHGSPNFLDVIQVYF